MGRLRVPLNIGILIGAQTAMAGPTSMMQWVDHYVLKRIKITGSRNLGYHLHEVEGDVAAYNATTYYGLGGKRFTDVGQVTLSGQNVLGGLNFNMTLNDNRFKDPQSQRISIDYKTGPLTLNLGDIRGSLLNTNRFASFNKQLWGASATVKTGRLAAKVVHSESKGSPRTVPIQGNNSAGPYYLRSNQIVVDSEEVQVDGLRMRPGLDYVINYDVGTITFVDRVIAPTSTIVVTFEALGINANRGTVQGGGVTYDLGKAGRVGLTMVEQKARSGGGLRSVVQEMEGYGSASHWYELDFEPLPSRPVIVRLNGVVQTEGVHYSFDPVLPYRFRFNFDVPPSSVVSVTYTPRPTQTVDGDRRVLGFDYRLPLGGDPRNYVQYSQANGQLLSGINPMSGTARGVEGQYHLGPWSLTASVRDVPRTFAGIETRGFNRNDKAIDLGLAYEQGPLSYGITHNNSSISLRNVANNGDILFRNSRSTQTGGYIHYNPTNGQPWSLEHVRTTSLYDGGETRLDTTSLTTRKSFGKINTSFGLEHQDGIGPITTGLSTQRGHLSLNTVQARADYTAGPLNLGLKSSFSSIEAAGSKGEGNDVSLTASYNPSDRLSVQTNYSISNSGKLATLGAFQNGLGLGYENNGFSGGLTNPGFTPGATDLRLLSLAARYKFSDRLSFDAQAYRSRSTGMLSSNADTDAMGVGLNWDLGGGHLFGLTYDQSNTKFLSSPSTSQMKALTANFVGSPSGPWSYRLGTSILLSGGSSPYKQDSMLFDGYLGFKVNSRQRATLSVQTGTTKGYLPQKDMLFSLAYEYQLFQNVGLVGSYRWRKVSNIDPNLLSGAYRASGFDIELTFNFGG
jgi:hypothetical protein